jgi:hypothetical protein
VQWGRGDLEMSDQEFEQAQTRIKGCCGKWIKPLGLLWWRDITNEFYRDSVSMARATNRETHTETIADTHVEWAYLDAVVRWNCEKVSTLSDDDLDYAVRHEFAHMLVAEMREWGDVHSENKIAHEERVCTMLGQAFDWIWKAAIDSVTSAPGGSSESQST